MLLASALSSSSSTSHSLQRQLKAIREEIDRDFTIRSATPPQALRSRSPNPFIQQRPDLAPGVIRCGAGVPAA